MGKVTRHRVVWQIHQGPKRCKLFSISCERKLEMASSKIFTGGRVSFSQKFPWRTPNLFWKKDLGLVNFLEKKKLPAWNFSPYWHKSRWNFEPKNWLDPPIGSNPTTKKALGKKHKKKTTCHKHTHRLQPSIYMESPYHQGTHSTPTDHRFASALWSNGANESWKVIVVSIWPFLISEIPGWWNLTINIQHYGLGNLSQQTCWKNNRWVNLLL